MFHTLLMLLASQPPAAGGPPVRIWLGSAPTLAAGIAERVYVQTRTDGNLVVLCARPDGRIEVLFPDNPASDPFVRAGTYEIRGPADGARGRLVAALSPDPMWFDEFVQNNRWQVGIGAGTDPEALLTDIVQRMLGDGSFNYDVAPSAPTTVTVRAIPLLARPRPAAAPLPAVMRSRLLVRFVHSARTEPVSSSIVAVAARSVAPASPPQAIEAAPAAPPAPILVPEPQLLVYEPQFLWREPQCAGRPDRHSRPTRAGPATAAPPAAQGGLSTGGGVGLRAVHTAGWRH